MAKSKLQRLVNAWQTVEALGFRIIRATSGQLYTVQIQKGKGTCVTEYDQQRALESIRWLMLDEDVSITQKVIKDAMAYHIHNIRSDTPQEVFIRVGECAGRHYIDLCDPAGRVVEVSESGWQVMGEAPVLFARPDKAMALPTPVKSADPLVTLCRFKQLLLLDDAQWLLVVGWLLSALNVRVEPFALVLQGLPGGGKTVTAMCLLSMIDPREAGAVRMSYSSDDLLLTAAERWVLHLEEVPNLTADKVATLNGIVTGMSYNARKKYTNAEIYSATVQRPMILTGNNNLLDSDALKDRSLPLIRRTLRPEDFRDRQGVFQQLDEMRPALLGALLDLMAAGLRQSTPIPTGSQLRMAGASGWIGRCFAGAGLDAGDFTNAVVRARRLLDHPPAEEWSVFDALRSMATVGYDGEMVPLLQRLEDATPDRTERVDWPKDASVLGRELRKRAQSLRAAGIQVEMRAGTGNRRLCRLSLAGRSEDRRGPSASPKSHPTSGAEVVAAFPNAVVASSEADGGAILYGQAVTQAVKLLDLPAEERQLLKLTKVEWDSIFSDIEGHPIVFV